MSTLENNVLSPAESIRLLSEKIQTENQIIQLLRQEVSKVISPSDGTQDFYQFCKTQAYDIEESFPHEQAVVNKVTKLNVVTAIEQITEQSDIINEMHKNKQIAIIGGVYDVSSGLVEFYEL